MSKELLEGVKALEKERGIEAETLLSAIEEALLALSADVRLYASAVDEAVGRLRGAAREGLRVGA